jgi:protein-S-isoprenylcysteine O-methyltransferase Ste14
MMDKQDEKGAAVKFPPPLIFMVAMGAGYGLQVVLPLSFLASSVAALLGGPLVVLSLGCIVYLNGVFTRLKTHIEPWKPTSSIISTGLYGYSRNPIYVAFAVITIGVGLMLNSAWVTLSFLPACVMVYWVAIRKEEAYLSKKFGDEYLNYKSKVRRWL